MAVKTALAKPKFKTYISDFTIRFDPISMRGRMVGVRKSDTEKPSFILVSPKGNPVEQKYRDIETGELFDNDQCDRQMIKGDTVTTIDKESLQALKVATLPKNVISLSVHDADEINDKLFVDKSNGYLFFPDEKDPKNVNLSRAFTTAVAGAKNRALIGVCNFHGYEGLFKVSIWRGHLLFQKHLYPADVNDHETVTLTTTNESKVIASFFDKKLEKFNPENYRNASADRVMEALANPDTIKDILASGPVPEDDDISSLLASLEDWGN